MAFGVVAFDALGTVFQLEGLRPRLEQLGLSSADGVKLWMSRILRDAAMLDLAGSFEPFRNLAVASLAAMIAERGGDPVARRAEQVVDGFSELEAHPSARPALEQLKAARYEIAVLTNGGAALTEQLLKRNGLDRLVTRVVSAEQVRHYKPHRELYLHTARAAKVEPDELWLVSAHSWDVHGASSAGLKTAWSEHVETQHHWLMKPPDVKGAELKRWCPV
jgi:2-haloacid dehalogenase